MNYTRLPTFAGPYVNLVVETPKGATAKLKFDNDLQAFAFSRPLPLGVAYPFDWGFIPSTIGEDGDPLDGLVLHDGATAPGVVIPCLLLGALCVEQTEEGETHRNDRFILRPRKSPRDVDLTDVEGISRRMRSEIEEFFFASALGTGKVLKFLEWQSAGGALKAVTAANSALENAK